MANKNDYLIKQNNFLNFNQNFTKEYLNDRYDEPTYLTFRVNFFPNNIGRPYDIKNVNNLFNNDIDTMSYNDMPEPLLQFSNEIIRPMTLIDNTFYGEDEENLIFDPEPNFIVINNNSKAYSTYDYLKNSLGDKARAELLETFINLLIKLNWDFPYYIKSIEGIDELLNVDPKRGSRIKKDAIITLKCYEGLDQRISTLKNLYKKIAWDETFQRWILPDMMRFFQMEIIISEFRIFHEHKGKKYENKNTAFNSKQDSKLNVVNTIKNTINTVGKLFGSNKSVGQNAWSLVHSSINASIPTTKLVCRMCEFDISNLFSNLNSISSSNPKEKPVDDLEIKIKIGNINEINYNGTITDSSNNELYIDDDILTFKKLYNIKEYKLKNLKKYINEEKTGIKSFEKFSETNMFNDDVESTSLSYLGKAIKDTFKGALDYADNLADKELNKLMMSQMGKSGLTFNDVLTAVTSANINTMYNTFKTKANAVKELYPEISMATNNKLDIQAFETFITNVANSDDKIQSNIAKILLDYGFNHNIESVDDYIDILNDVNNEIQNEIKNKIINIAKNENELSQATKSDNKIDTKIIL